MLLIEHVMESGTEVVYRPDQEQGRKEIVRNIPIHPGLQSILGDELFGKYNNNRSSVNPLEAHPRIHEIIQDNPQVQFGAIKDSEGRIENWVIDAPVSGHLRLVTILEKEFKPWFSTFTPLAVVLLNQEGKAISLLDYFPHSAITNERKIYITMDMALGNKSVSVGGLAVLQPPVTFRTIGAMLHEAGHIWAGNVHSEAKYSEERDAAAFVSVAARELRRRGFLLEEDTREIIEKQRSALAVYQSGIMRRHFSGEAFTRESVNLERFRRIEERKPEGERRTRRKVFEDLSSSLRQLSTEFIGRAQEIQVRYNLREGEFDIFDARRNYLVLPPNIFQVIASRNEVALQEYSPGENGEVLMVYYTFSPKGVTISRHRFTEGGRTEQLEFTSIGFDETQSELGVDIGEWKEEVEKIRIFLQACEGNRPTRIRIGQHEVLEQLSGNKSAV